MKLLFILLVTGVIGGCSKHTDDPGHKLTPVISTQITCLKWAKVTKTVGNYTFTTYNCIEKRIDTFKTFQ